MGGKLIASGYLRGDKLMLVVGNYGGYGRVPIALDAKKLGFALVVGAHNAETQAGLAVRDNRVMLTINKHDLALVEVQLAR